MVWDDNNKPRWRHLSEADVNDIGYLRGNLDIIIRCENYDPILIDAKNIFFWQVVDNKRRINSSVTDKVYKMIGYLNNFEKKVCENRNGKGILIFKNTDNKLKKERIYLSDNGEAEVSIFSVDISNEATNFSVLSEYILNHFDLFAQRNIELRKIKDEFRSVSTEKDLELKYIEVEKIYTTSINVLTRGKESELDKAKETIEFNFFGEDLWNQVDEETKQYLAQSEFLLTSMKDGNDLEYSMYAINYSKAIENELHIKIVLPLKNYLLSQSIYQDNYFVINNIVNDKHVSLGQIGKLLNSNNRHIKNYIANHFGQGELGFKRQKEIKIIGKELTEFAEKRNTVAHKDGISHSKLIEIRSIVLGVGDRVSLLSMLLGIK